MEKQEEEKPKRVETPTIKKGNFLHFLSSDRIEEITSTKKANNIYEGELTTDKNEYSVDFIQRWRKSGFLKIYKK